ncbi:MAG TPA: hypothetical protein VGF56_09555 [Rhizomicrobium sp.]|jgi:hypothetical protein
METQGLSSQIVLGILTTHTILQLATIAAAVVTIYFGYRLFHLAESKSTAEFEVSGTFGKVRLARAAPGIFFTLFGCGVLVAALAHPAQLQLSGSAPSSGASLTATAGGGATLIASGVGSGQTDLNLRECARTTDFLMRTVREGPTYAAAPPAGRQTYDAKLAKAEQVLAFCVDRSLGIAGAYRRYKHVEEQDLRPGGNNDVSVEDRTVHDSVSALLAS